MKKVEYRILKVTQSNSSGLSKEFYVIQERVVLLGFIKFPWRYLKYKCIDYLLFLSSKITKAVFELDFYGRNLYYKHIFDNLHDCQEIVNILRHYPELSLGIYKEKLILLDDDRAFKTIKEVIEYMNGIYKTDSITIIERYE